MNCLKLVGVTTADIAFNHVFVGMYGSKRNVMETIILCKSPKNVFNKFKVLFFEDGSHHSEFEKEGQLVVIKGMFNSFNKFNEGLNKRILELYINPFSVNSFSENNTNYNRIVLKGNICGNPITKTSLRGRAVTEVKLKVERDTQKGRFDYIPIVALDIKSKHLEKFKDGDDIHIEGKIHSRDYIIRENPNNREGIKEIKTAYEIGVYKFFPVTQKEP